MIRIATTILDINLLDKYENQNKMLMWAVCKSGKCKTQDFQYEVVIISRQNKT